MAYTTGTLTGTYKKTDGTAAWGVVEIIPNSRYLLDSAGNKILAGRLTVDLDAQGSFSVVLPSTDDATVQPSTNRQYTVSAKLHHTRLPAVTGIALPGGTTVDLADVTSAAEVAAVASAYLDVLAAATDAASSATAATAAAASIQSAPQNEGFLGRISQAQTGPFRILLNGTSIQTFDRSPIQVLVEQLKTIYGDSGYYSIRGGILGGSLTAAYNGWKKQRFAGVFFIRSRGEAGSSDLVFNVNGDRIELEFSRETDAEAANILIDGVTVGTTPAAGAQAFGQRQVFTTTAGMHTVTIKAPTGAGFVYFERMAAYNNARTGIEVIDGTQGGTLLSTMVTDVAATGGMAATIPVVGDNGVNAWYTRTDIDAFFVGQVVNDAGAAPLGSYFTATYKPTMDKVVAKTRALRRPLMAMIEMAGHYIMPNDAGSSSRHAQFVQIADYLRGLKANNHVTIVDHHLATAMDDDIPGYAARYYTGVTGLNVAAGTYTGDFVHADDGPATQIGIDLIHKVLALTPPKQRTASDVRFERLRRLPATIGKDQLLTIAGTTKKYPQAAGIAVLSAGQGDSSLLQYKQVPYFRDPSPTNLAQSLQDGIVAAGTSDTYGAYEDWTLKNLGLSGTVPWLTGGTKRLLTIRASGNILLRAYGVAEFLTPEGQVMPRTDTVNGRTELHLNLTGSEPVVVSVWVSGTAASGNGLGISGRVYEITFADTSGPVLSYQAAAGAQGPTGSAGPAGGLGSAVLTGSWSAPTIFGSLSTAAMVAGEMVMVPFVPLDAGSIDQLGIAVTTLAASSTIALGLYDSDTAHRPTTRLADGGTVDSSTTGWKKGTAFTAVPLTAGKVYWLAALALGGTPQIRYANGISPLILSGDSDATLHNSYCVTGQSSLPATVSSWGTLRAVAPFVRAHAA